MFLPFLIDHSNRMFIISEGHHNILPRVWIIMSVQNCYQVWVWVVLLFCLSFNRSYGNSYVISYEVSLPKISEALTKYLKWMIQRRALWSVKLRKLSWKSTRVILHANAKWKIVKIKRKYTRKRILVRLFQWYYFKCSIF